MKRENPIIGGRRRRQEDVVEIVLVPGLWLNASTWDAVVPLLEEAGHTARPLTLPGMESKETDRTAASRRPTERCCWVVSRRSTARC
jgi:hypothetical protein